MNLITKIKFLVCVQYIHSGRLPLVVWAKALFKLIAIKFNLTFNTSYTRCTSPQHSVLYRGALFCCFCSFFSLEKSRFTFFLVQFHFFLFEKMKCNENAISVCICVHDRLGLAGLNEMDAAFIHKILFFIHLSWLRMVLNYIFTIKIANISIFGVQTITFAAVSLLRQ